MHGTPCYESEGRRFESCRARTRKPPQIAGFCFWPYRLKVDLTTYLITYLCEKRLEKRPKASAWMCGMTCA
jgi:hypothetical protein